MSYYDCTHALIFESLDDSSSANTWDDWHLIPTSRPTLSMPGAQNKFVEIPGMNGSYDISDYLTSDIVFTDRSGSFEFVVDNGHEDWITIWRNIAVFLHGKRLRMRLTDDPSWYYEGRFTLDEWKSDKARSQISISYRVAPFKFSIYGDYATDIIWDDFCFERDFDFGVFYHIEVSGDTVSRYIQALGARSTVMARLVSGGPVTIRFSGNDTVLSVVNEEKNLGQTGTSGVSSLTLSGTGVVDIGWPKISL